MNAYKEELYGDYPRLSNNELPWIIGCLHIENMEDVQNFFLRSLYRDVTIHEITRWKRNCQPSCVYTVVYKMKDKTPDLSGKEILVPFLDNDEDLKKMFRHITEMVFGMLVVEKKHSEDRVYASISYVPVRCACNALDFELTAEEPRMRSTITEVKVTGTEDLDRVTQVKLRVIARDVPLQHLSVYIPALRELILDGSVVSSFRDLGCSLKNLKILRVNRCGIEFLDNMLGLESLEELYVADNLIENCMPLAFLTNVKIVDLRRNRLKNTTRTLTFLTICEKLEHIYLEGNGEISQFPKYRQTVKSLLPGVRSLDGVSYTEDECNGEVAAGTDHELQRYLTQKAEEAQTSRSNLGDIINGVNSARARPVTSDTSNGFTIRFPPKVFLGRSTSSNKK